MNKSRSTLFFSASVLIIFLIGESCVSHDFPLYTCPNEVTYTNNVRTLVDTKCTVAPCHGTNPDLPNWDDLSTLQQHADYVRQRVMERSMPPDGSPAGPLTQEEINTIACWVDAGAQNN
jgi:hypothetical protein